MIVSVFFTAGYPKIDDTLPILIGLENAGVERIEIGIPFSDPLADGPVIQESSLIALQNGMTIKKLFYQLKEFQQVRHTKPTQLYLMGYFNPILRFGVGDFLKQAYQCGIRGLIIPDLPLGVYQKEYAKLFKQNNMEAIFLITPHTSEKRIREIDEMSGDFIYAVSKSGVTGNNINDTNESRNYFERIKNMKLRNPLVIGFGIKNATTSEFALKYCSGVIVGTAFIQHLKINGVSRISEFVNSFLPVKTN